VACAVAVITMKMFGNAADVIDSDLTSGVVYVHGVIKASIPLLLNEKTPRWQGHARSVVRKVLILLVDPWVCVGPARRCKYVVSVPGKHDGYGVGFVVGVIAVSSPHQKSRNENKSNAASADKSDRMLPRVCVFLAGVNNTSGYVQNAGVCDLITPRDFVPHATNSAIARFAGVFSWATYIRA
jgi:hypothetical protein